MLTSIAGSPAIPLKEALAAAKELGDDVHSGEIRKGPSATEEKVCFHWCSVGRPRVISVTGVQQAGRSNVENDSGSEDADHCEPRSGSVDSGEDQEEVDSPSDSMEEESEHPTDVLDAAAAHEKVWLIFRGCRLGWDVRLSPPWCKGVNNGPKPQPPVENRATQRKSASKKDVGPSATQSVDPRACVRAVMARTRGRNKRRRKS